MNDGHYTNIRNYLEEIAGQQKQILAAVQRTNELLEKMSAPTTTSKAKGETSEFIEGSETPPKTATKKGKPKPAVNWNS